MTTLFIARVQYLPKGETEWKTAVGPAYVKDSMAKIREVADRESKDFGGGLIDWGTNGRRLWVREVEVVGEEYLKLAK